MRRMKRERRDENLIKITLITAALNLAAALIRLVQSLIESGP